MFLLMSLWTAQGACALDVPASAPFEIEAPDDAGNVHLILLVRVDDAHLDAARAVQASLDARGLHAGFSVRLGEPSAPVGAFLGSLTQVGHEPVVRLVAGELPVGLSQGPKTLRKALAPLQRHAGKIRATEAPLGNRSSEAILQRMGLRAVLETNGPSHGTPRPQSRFDGQPNLGIVLPAGPYSGPCGDQPIARGLTPASADRVTQALYGARGESVSVVRLTLVPRSTTDAEVLGRWLDEVVLPKGVRISTPSEARQAVLKGLRSGPGSSSEAARTEGGRLIRIDEVNEAAIAVAELDTIPRRLPGDLAPTEAFQAFLKLVTGRKEANVVRLGSLDGPVSPAKGSLMGPRAFPRDSVVTLAAALLDDLPTAIPAALPVGGTLLTAPELFTLLASAARGEDPAIARPIASPEPNAEGLGWGRATTP